MALVGATSQRRMSPYFFSQLLEALVLLSISPFRIVPLPCRCFWQASEAVYHDFEERFFLYDMLFARRAGSKLAARRGAHVARALKHLRIGSDGRPFPSYSPRTHGEEARDLFRAMYEPSPDSTPFR
jgi:hypothetical protein